MIKGQGLTLKSIATMLKCLQLCLEAEDDAGCESILEIMEKLLVEAVKEDIRVYTDFASAGVSGKDVEKLLAHAVKLKPGTELHHHLLRVLPFLTYADDEKMSLVIRHFDDILDFVKFDSGGQEAKMAAFVAMCEGIERGRKIGKQFI